MNYINKVKPIGITKTIVLNATAKPEVYTPFNSKGANAEFDCQVCRVNLPGLFFRK